MKGFNAIQPGLNCFISMTISVASRCGFQPLSSVDEGKVQRPVRSVKYTVGTTYWLVVILHGELLEDLMGRKKGNI